MDRSPDGVATLKSSLSSVSVRDATANPSPHPSATTTPESYSADPNPTLFAPTSHPPIQHVSSIMEPDSTAVAEDRSRRATSVLSMEDLEAAQALEGLRTGILSLCPVESTAKVLQILVHLPTLIRRNRSSSS